MTAFSTSDVDVDSTSDAVSSCGDGGVGQVVLSDGEALNWYALRVFQNRSAAVRAEVERSGYEYYVPTRLVERNVFGRKMTVQQPLVMSIVFVRATSRYIESLSKDQMISATAYRQPGTNCPAVISDREMEIFMLVTRVGADTAEMVDLSLAQGDRVRVTDGPFKGAEGYIARVHGAKRLIVAIEGVAAIALTYIPKNFLEKIV